MRFLEKITESDVFKLEIKMRIMMFIKIRVIKDDNTYIIKVKDEIAFIGNMKECYKALRLLYVYYKINGGK